MDFFDHVDETYGVTNESVVREDDEGVLVPESDFVLQQDHYEELMSIVRPQTHSDSYGIDLYQATLIFLYDKIRSNPNMYGELMD